MKIKKTFFAALALALASSFAASAADTAAPAADGFALYAQHCAKCHGKTGKADTWRGALAFAQDFTEASFQSDNSNDEILDKINRGPRIMPSYEEKLTLDERKALVQVLRSFGFSQR